MKLFKSAACIILATLLLAACTQTPPVTEPSADATVTTTTVVVSTTTSQFAEETTTAGESSTTTDPATHTTIVTQPPVNTTAKPTTPPTTSKPTTSAPALSKNNVEVYGRIVESKDGYRFDWSGSTVEGGFKGTAAEMDLRILSGSDVDYFNIYIDGQKVSTLTVKKSETHYVLAEGLSDGYHTVRVEKRTEGNFGAYCEFLGFTFPGGEAAPAPARPTRYIEVMGDSITAAYGNVSPANALGFKLEEEDYANSYAKFTADHFGAYATVLGWSGGGLTRDIVGLREPVFRNDLFWRSAALSVRKNWTFTPKPDVVVINLGTNDFQDAFKALPDGFAEEYSAHYIAFLEEIRKVYPDAHIVCAMGPMTMEPEPYIQAVVKARNDAGDKAVSYCSLSYEGADLKPGEKWGADMHPSVLGHWEMSRKLIAHIEKTLGW